MSNGLRTSKKNKRGKRLSSKDLQRKDRGLTGPEVPPLKRQSLTILQNQTNQGNQISPKRMEPIHALTRRKKTERK